MTGWLYGLYQKLAGKPMHEPLTFGDLWSASRRDGRAAASRLSLMSVNLSLGRPVRITCDDEHEHARGGRGILVRPGRTSSGSFRATS